MSYNLVYTRKAEKDIKKLDSSIKGRIGNALLKLQVHPREVFADPITQTAPLR